MEDRECPLIKKITENYCFDINMVVDDLAPESTIPQEITKIPNYKEVCKNCKYHNTEE